MQEEKRNSLSKIKADLKNAGSTGDKKDFSKTMTKFEQERKSIEDGLEEKFHQAVDENHSYLELDRSTLRERAAQKEKEQLKEIHAHVKYQI